MNRKIVFTAILSLHLGACATGVSSARTRLYPNDHLRSVGDYQAQRDIEECQAQAAQYAEDPDGYLEYAKKGAGGAALGAGAGALTGVITKGKVGRTTAAGAAVGAVAGIAHELFTRDGSKGSQERFVEYCLQRQGYEIMPSR